MSSADMLSRALDGDIAMAHERFVRAMEARLPTLELASKERYFAVLTILVAKLEIAGEDAARGPHRDDGRGRPPPDGGAERSRAERPSSSPLRLRDVERRPRHRRGGELGPSASPGCSPGKIRSSLPHELMKTSMAANRSSAAARARASARCSFRAGVGGMVHPHRSTIQSRRIAEDGDDGGLHRQLLSQRCRTRQQTR